MTTLFSPLKTEIFTLENRIFMAPMTRSRAPERIPTDLMAEYYAQRASAGLIFSEGTQVSSQGIGYIFTPGIHTDEQVLGWKKVTDAVHQKGGLIFAQLWHCGRVSHPDFHDGQLPVAPSAISFEGKAFTPSGQKDVVTPRELTIKEIEQIIEDHHFAAEMAKKAGFDGVEIHGANGYLPAQFLEDGSNKRTDIYGGSVENRARFILALTDAAISVWGAGRVSVRLSPRNPYNGMSDSHPEETYLYVAKELGKRNVGFLHVLEGPKPYEGVTPLVPAMREVFKGILVQNYGFDKTTGNEFIAAERADAISFGSLFIANPDLPERFKGDAALNTPDQATFYGGDALGYTDYPTMKKAGA